MANTARAHRTRPHSGGGTLGNVSPEPDRGPRTAETAHKSRQLDLELSSGSLPRHLIEPPVAHLGRAVQSTRTVMMAPGPLLAPLRVSFSRFVGTF